MPDKPSPASDVTFIKNRPRLRKAPRESAGTSEAIHGSQATTATERSMVKMAIMTSTRATVSGRPIVSTVSGSTISGVITIVRTVQPNCISLRWPMRVTCRDMGSCSTDMSGLSPASRPSASAGAPSARMKSTSGLVRHICHDMLLKASNQ